MSNPNLLKFEWKNEIYCLFVKLVESVREN